MTAISTALSGLQASATRLAGSASNIANMRSRGPIPETPPVAPVARRAEPAPAPAARAVTLRPETLPQVYQPVETVQTTRDDKGTKAILKPASPSFIPEYDPDSTHANDDGFVAAPDVDPVGEMVNQMEALRSFRANMATVRVAGETEDALLSLQA